MNEIVKDHAIDVSSKTMSANKLHVLSRGSIKQVAAHPWLELLRYRQCIRPYTLCVRGCRRSIWLANDVRNSWFMDACVT